jgi:4-hydroxy-2-oxoglutarate aldolase
MIKGIFPPIPTPFVDGELSTEMLRANIDKWNSTDLAGYVVMGSNGESVFLTFNEKLRLTESVKKFAAPDKIIIAGTGSDSYKDTIELSNRAAEAGADYVLVLTPSYYTNQMDSLAILIYFERVADEVKIPIIIYNVPKFTGVNIQPETVAKLSEHENIVGIKNSSEDIEHLEKINRLTPNDFSVLVGTASVLYPAFKAGAVGGIVALANIAPNECIEVLQKFIEGNLTEAESLQARLVEPNKAVTAKYGVPGLKAAMDMLGYFGGEPRIPLSKLPPDDTEELKNILIRNGLLKN